MGDRVAVATVPRLIFLHVPRTSGSTLHGILSRQYRPEETHTEEIFLPPDVQRFRDMPEDQRARIRLLKGHLSFGLHEFMPGPSTYLTMVRDPIDRLVSYYYYVKRRPAAVLHGYVKGVDLATFVSEGRARDHTDNSFVRFFSGSPFVEQGTIDERLLDRAKANLAKHFVLIGQQRYFDESILMLKQELGWTPPYYRNKNVTKGRPKVAEIDDRTRRILEEHTVFDREIFDYCTKLFREKLESMPEGFHRDLRSFRRRNRALQGAYRVLQPLRERLPSARH